MYYGKYIWKYFRKNNLEVSFRKGRIVFSKNSRVQNIICWGCSEKHPVNCFLHPIFLIWCLIWNDENVVFSFFFFKCESKYILNLIFIKKIRFGFSKYFLNFKILVLEFSESLFWIFWILIFKIIFIKMYLFYSKIIFPKKLVFQLYFKISFLKHKSYFNFFFKMYFLILHFPLFKF